MIIFMGVAGAGKSVQGTMLADKFGYTWLSTGEYLRAHLSEDQKAEMIKGKLIDDKGLIEILENFFDGIQDQSRCVLDGFPRTLAQAQWLLRQHKEGRIKIAEVIYLEASKDVVTGRLLSRGRPDDTPEALHRRFADYERLTLPIIDWFEENGITVHRIDANRSVEEIHKEICNSLAR